MSEFEKMNKIKLDVFSNEHWWSGTAALGCTMPYDCKSNYSVDQIHNTTNNQVSPVLMSDHGRLLYAPGGLIYTFNGGELTVCGEDIVCKTLDGGIKACFGYLKTNIFPDDDEFPDEDLIIHPQYNTWIELTHYQCEEKIIEYLEKKNIKNEKSFCASYIKEAIEDSYKRLIFPSVQREIRSDLTEKGTDSAIDNFGKNLEALLLTPPMKEKVVLAFDPGFVNGCKIAVISKTGDYLDSCVIKPFLKNINEESIKKCKLEN